MENMRKMANPRCLYRLALCILAVPAALAMPGRVDNNPATPTYANSVTEAHETTTPAPRPQDVVDNGILSAGDYVVMVVNSHTAAISTAHRQNVGSPAVGGPNTIGVGQTGMMAVPTGWAGVVAVGEVPYPLNDRASLIEGSFVDQYPSDPVRGGKAKAAFDVSYVDGFTVPIVCQCQGMVVMGCNLNLHQMCPGQYRFNEKTCINPHRDGQGAGVGNFFEACRPMAYTLPSDESTVNGHPACVLGMTCCVGTACPAHPKQQLCPGANGYPRRCDGAGMEATEVSGMI
ncbi:hypothetical protein F5X96DRAFT_433289 [Biscogniauxia mediterranea]|nr:hypothetical protein F5X96DRAFT_433289 [Biscogniauxia mediterranea]